MNLTRSRSITAFIALMLAVLSPKVKADDPATVTVSGSEPGDTVIVLAGTEHTINFSASINHDPAVNQECKLEGMTWEWSPTGGTISSTGSSASVTFNFDTPGTYTVGAAAAAVFETSCIVDNQTKPGDSIRINGSKNYTVKVIQKVWSPNDQSGHTLTSKMLSPQDQTSNTPTPQQVSVYVGGKLTCSVQEISNDTDTWTLDSNADGTIQPGETGYETSNVTYEWSGAGSFQDSSAPSTQWTAPSTPGTYTLECKIDDGLGTGDKGIGAHEDGTRNDDEVTRSVEVVVYSITLQANRKGGTSAIVAAGGLGGVHQADLVVQATPAVAGLQVPGPIIIAGGQGKDENPNVRTAQAVLDSTVTDADGKIHGTFTSGKRVQVTTVAIDFDGDPEAPHTGPTVDISERWNELPDEGTTQEPNRKAWFYEEFAYIGEPSSITYKMAFVDGGDLAIPGHSLEFKNTALSGLKWDATAGPKDDAGNPLGAWMPAEYNSHQAISDAGLGSVVTFSTASESPAGAYNTQELVQVLWDSQSGTYFIPESVGFYVYDNSVFKSPPPPAG